MAFGPNRRQNHPSRMSANNYENCGGERIKAFRARLQSGAENVPRPAQFTDAADLKVKLLRALPSTYVDNTVSPHALDAPIPAPPANATELQRMLHRHLHEHWPVLSQCVEFCRAAVFDDVPLPLTAAKVFALAREGEVDHLLVWTPEYFRDTRGAVWHTADVGGRHGVVCGALLRVVLVAAERHVLGAGTTLADADDPVLETNAADTIGYVKAAACLGFGLCFLPGNDEPANVFRLRHPLAEFGNHGEEGPALTNAELWAAIERKTSTDPGKDFTVGYLRQQIKRLAKQMGTGLVAVAVPEGRFANPGARAQLRAHLQTFDLRSFFLRQQCSAMPGWLQQVENDLRDAFAPIFSRAPADTPPTPAVGDSPA